jgi:hypothetical protein
MPETPDFDQIARRVLDPQSDDGAGLPGTVVDDAYFAARRRDIAEQLRLGWNARGAADIEAAKYAENDRGGAPYPDLDAIVEDIGELDR